MRAMGPSRHRARPRGAQRKASRRLLCVEPLEDRRLLSLSGNELFPDNSPWNQRVDAAPAAANSATLVASNSFLGTAEVVGIFDSHAKLRLHRVPAVSSD